MAEKKKPCCTAAAMSRRKYIHVNGLKVGISRLDAMLDGAAALENEGEEAVRRELLRLVKINNYVPQSAEKDYEEALYAEYKKVKVSRRSSESSGERRK